MGGIGLEFKAGSTIEMMRMIWSYINHLEPQVSLFRLVYVPPLDATYFL